MSKTASGLHCVCKVYLWHLCDSMIGLWMNKQKAILHQSTYYIKSIKPYVCISQSGSMGQGSSAASIAKTHTNLVQYRHMKQIASRSRFDCRYAMDAQYPQPSAVQRLIPEVLCNLCFPSITILQELLLVIQQLLK